MRLKVFIILWPFCGLINLKAQSLNDGNFARHLYQQQLYSDLFHLTDQFIGSPIHDSVLLYASLAAIQLDSILRLQSYLIHTNANSSPHLQILKFYQDSRLKKPIAFSYTTNYEKGFDELNFWMKSQYILLMHDTSSFRKLELLQGNNFWFSDNFQRSEKSIQMISEIKNKKPWVAGTLSALVPGLGKVYNNKPLQGLSAFMVCASLGYQTFEAYKNRNVSAAPLYIFGSMLGAFYFGNIYGSAIGVTVSKNRLNAEIDNQILLTMRSSLHRFYR